MPETTSDYIVQRLYAWGVRTIYGYPGDGINGMMGALDRADGRIRFVQTRHEEIAAFAAGAHAKFTGEVGVCLATSGPGAIHLLNGLYDAQMDHQPVVAIVGQQARTALGADYQPVLADDLPYVTGSIGLLGTMPSAMMMQECDTLLVIGSSFPYSEWLPREGQARGVQIDLSPRMLGLRYPMEVNLHGDSRLTLQALMPYLAAKTDRSWRQRIEESVRDWWAILEKRAMTSADPINPQRVFWELSPRLPDRCILTADSGSCANWWARDLRLRPGMLASLSGNLATMGPALPYALAGKLAHPDRPVIASIGDGAMQMLGNNVLITVAERWRDWQNPCFVVLVLNNGDLNQVTWEQRVMAGDPKFESSQRVPKFPYAEYAKMLGLDAYDVNDPERIAPALDAALAAKRPAVVEVHTDPEVPPLPPHISFEQAKKYWSALLKGDPERWRMIKQSVKEMWATVSAPMSRS